MPIIGHLGNRAIHTSVRMLHLYCQINKLRQMIYCTWISGIHFFINRQHIQNPQPYVKTAHNPLLSQWFLSKAWVLLIRKELFHLNVHCPEEKRQKTNLQSNSQCFRMDDLRYTVDRHSHNDCEHAPDFKEHKTMHICGNSLLHTLTSALAAVQQAITRSTVYTHYMDNHLST